LPAGRAAANVRPIPLDGAYAMTDDAVRMLARSLLEAGVGDLTAHERKVILKLAERKSVARDVNTQFDEQLSFGDRVADQVAAIGGSWAFILAFAAVILTWVGLNSVLLVRWGGPFDPYPYIFLNLLLSMLAAIQAPVIMMSQNRQAEKDRLAAAHDYEVNLKAEIEIMALHDKLDQLRTEHIAALVERVDQLLGERTDNLLGERTDNAAD
jgi:uncharacterized membrane protein